MEYSLVDYIIAIKNILINLKEYTLHKVYTLMIKIHVNILKNEKNHIKRCRKVYHTFMMKTIKKTVNRSAF